MAKPEMNYSGKSYAGDVEVLYNSAYVADAIMLDETAFTDGLCKAGNPIAVDGTVANTASAYGILLHDVVKTRPQGTVVVSGHINKDVAEAHAGVEYATAAMAALKNIVFISKSDKEV